MNVKLEIPAIMAIASQLLKRSFIDCIRADAKRAFRVLEDGKALLLADVKMDDGSTIRFSAALQLDEFRGHMNFSTLRDQLQHLCGAYERSLADEKMPRVMSDEKGEQHAIFLPVISDIEGQINALVMALDCRNSGEIRLQLMYLDPDQFRSNSDVDQTA